MQRTSSWVLVFAVALTACGSSDDSGLYSDGLFTGSDSGAGGSGLGGAQVKKLDAGIGGFVSTGGVPGGGGAPGAGGAPTPTPPPCVGLEQSCAAASQCCNGRCGAAGDEDDCKATGKCVECNSDDQCPTGRCDNCHCESPHDDDHKCNEDSDCQSGRCDDDKCKSGAD